LKILGIESTAHTFGIGQIKNGQVVANKKQMFQPEEGGFHPRKASEHHYKNAEQVLKEAESEGFKASEADKISFSQGPGLRQCLDIGSTVAKSLSYKHDIPLVGVNHCASHISIGTSTTPAENPITLYVSGGNTQVIVPKNGFKVLGETLDIALGNALDKLARSMNIPYPGGPEIESLAQETDRLKEASYPIKGMNFSFSGLLTEIQRQDCSKEVKANTFQEHAYAAATEALERALAQAETQDVLLTGGVAMNNRLRKMVEKMCRSRNANYHVPPKEYCMDNGAMIADRGIERSSSDLENVQSSGKPMPNWRPDQI
jgi:glycoprotease/Kae1 family metallohydrolase